MIIYLCSCGFPTDDPDWFDGHQDQHPIIISGASCGTARPAARPGYAPRPALSLWQDSARRVEKGAPA